MKTREEAVAVPEDVSSRVDFVVVDPDLIECGEFSNAFSRPDALLDGCRRMALITPLLPIVTRKTEKKGERI